MAAIAKAAEVIYGPNRPNVSAFSVNKRKLYEMTRSQLWLERSTFDAQYRDLNDYILPRRLRAYTTDRNKGDRRNLKIIDSTATFAARTLRAGMHSGFTSPARPWLKLTTPDPSLAEYGAVKEWLSTVTNRMLTVFHATNLYNMLPILYGDMGVFATGTMGVMEDDDDLLRCYSYPVGSYAIGVDDRGLISTFVREYETTVINVVKEFLLNKRTNEIDWSMASRALRNCWDNQQYQAAVKVCWIVNPNIDADPKKYQAKFKPFYSCWFEFGQDDQEHFLRESGFDDFPVIAGRWERTGEDAYGTDCPGMTCIGDIKQLQTGEKRSLQAVEKMINPPLQGPTSIRNQKASLLPGDLTYIDLREGQKGLTPIHETQFALDAMEMKQQGCRYRVQRAFYEDLFLMMATMDQRKGVQPPTATEVAERHEEKLLALGPVTEGTNDDVLDRLVDRAYKMMDRAGLIPPAPDELHNVKLKVEYISLLAQAQKLVGVQGHERFVNFAIQVGTVFPKALHKININKVIEDEADMLGVDPKILVPDDQADASYDQAQQQAMMLEKAKAAHSAAQTGKAMSETKLQDGSSVLDKAAEAAT